MSALNILDNLLSIILKNIPKSDEQKYGDILVSPNASISLKMRTCFQLKSLNTNDAIDELNRGFKSKSALLKHEIAYVMGQMNNEYAIPYLSLILKDENQEIIVRHEAAEALAAIGNISVKPLLLKYSKHVNKELKETCLLGLKTLENNNGNKDKKSNHNSIDPAHSFDDMELNKNNIEYIKKIENIYLDKNECLYNRYKAMFTLRDIGSNECIKILCKGFNDDSALFKHEICFVLGQLMNSIAINDLINVLKNKNEHEMVRHEAAEALGSIANDKCLPIIKEYLNDDKIVVKQSCQVALDIHNFWNNDDV